MDIATDLRAAAPGAMVSDDTDDLLAYRDIHGQAGRISCVVLPRSYEDVSGVLAYCVRSGVPVVPWGGGTNLSGALTPSRRAVAMDLKALNSVIVVDADALTVTVQAGATPDAVDRSLARHGLRFHHDPWSRRSATIGGSLALDSAGTLYRRYGRIGDQVLSLRVALADGSIVEALPGGGDDPPASAARTYIGTEGVMGVILEATFRVHRVPGTYRTAGFGYRDLERMIDCLSSLGSDDLAPDSFIGGSIPKVVRELQPAVDRAMMRALGICCGLFVYYEGDPEEADRRTGEAVKLLGRRGMRMPQKYSDGWWPTRHTYFESNPGAVNADLRVHVYDMVIPPERTMEMVSVVEALAAGAGLSDGLSHTLFTSLDAYTVALYLRPGDRERTSFRTFESGIIDAALELGSVMRIHGYGTNFAPEVVRRALGDRLDALVEMKAALDPTGMLNPGILIPQEGPEEAGR